MATVSTTTGATTSTTRSGKGSNWSIPSSLQDLEETYCLQPYSNDFEHHNEAARFASFNRLISQLEHGNRYLVANYNTAVEDDEDDDDEAVEEWIEEGRLQAMYTLVRYVMCSIVIPCLPE
jgi:hypothetical protein